MKTISLDAINNVNGVTSGLVRTRDASRNDLTRTDSEMIASQSRWFGGRLVVTAGARVDKQAVWGSTADLNGNGDINDDRDPVSRLFPKRRRVANATRSQGHTSTYGIVYNVLPQLGLFYNSANNFVPQSDLDIFGRLLGNRRGEGKDMGVRLALLDNRLSGSISRYETTEVNRSVGRDNAYINAMNAIWQALGKVDKFADTASRDSQDTAGKGWEYDLTANLTPNWRASLNYAQTRQITTNIQPRNLAYVEANRAEWSRNPTIIVPTGFGLPANATIATAISTIDALYAGFKQSEGQTRRQLRRDTGNFFTSYTLRRSDSWLNGLTVGGGVQYRGDAVVGYDATRGNAPLYGGAYTVVNAMTAYNLRLSEEVKIYRKFLQRSKFEASIADGYKMVTLIKRVDNRKPFVVVNSQGLILGGNSTFNNLVPLQHLKESLHLKQFSPELEVHGRSRQRLLLSIKPVLTSLAQ